MNSVLCLIFDKVASQYTAPLCFTNEDCAKRYFIGKFKSDPDISDYELYLIGSYNSDNGVVVVGEKVLLMKGCDLNG